MKVNNSSKGQNLTENVEGFKAYSLDTKTELVSAVLTSFYSEDKFYGDTTIRILELAEKVEPKFLARLTQYARLELNMRSITHMLACILANREDGKIYARETVKSICVRADDTTEILAYYIKNYGKPIPNSLKKGLFDALLGFNEYQLAKYDRDTEVKLRDVLRICHGKVADAEKMALLGRVKNRTLAIPFTWETELSAKGNNKETWNGLIEKGLPYMAALRNLRNIFESGANIDHVLEMLVDPTRVQKAKQLPFRYLTAYKELGITNCGSKILNAISTALDVSVQNIGKLGGKTAIFVDVSGSMRDSISEKSTVRCCDIALLLGVISAQICDDTYFWAFDNDIYKINATKGNVLSQVQNIRVNGGGTNISLPFSKILESKIFVDRIILISDSQANMGGYSQVYLNRYRNTINPNVYTHCIDLQGYGTTQINMFGKNTNYIAGWSEKILDYISLAEQGADTLLTKIQEYKGKQSNDTD